MRRPRIAAFKSVAARLLLLHLLLLLQGPRFLRPRAHRRRLRPQMFQRPLAGLGLAWASIQAAQAMARVQGFHSVQAATASLMVRFQAATVASVAVIQTVLRDTVVILALRVIIVQRPTFMVRDQASTVAVI